MYNTQDRFSFVRLLTCGGIAFLLLGLFLTSSAQADAIYAVRVNALNGPGNSNFYSNYASSDNNSSQWCTEPNSTTYNFDNGLNPVMLYDLGSIQTINSITLSPYTTAAVNSIKDMLVEFYTSPAIDGTPVASQTFSGIQSNKSTTCTLTDPVNAKYVKITVTGNHGGNRVGISDIMFNVSSNVRPTSGTVSVATISGMSVANLYDNSSSTRWCSNDGAGSGNDYFDKFEDPVFTFDLNGTKNLSGVTVQAYHISGNSIKNFELEFLDSAENTISVEDASKYKFSMTDSANTVQNSFSFPTVEGVSKVKMTVTGNFKGVGSGGDRIAFSEVYFNTIATESHLTPVMYDSPMHADNIVRPISASFFTPGSESAADSGYPLTNLFDGTGTNSGNGVWCTIMSENDYFNKGFSPVIDFTMPSESMYDSFSIWGYFEDYRRSQMTDFILELFDSSGNLVFAEEYKITQLLSNNNYVTFSLGANYLFSKARLTALDNGYYWFNSSGGDRVGFAEIAFYQQPYYFVNTADIDLASWTINGTDKQGVLFTQGDQSATFENSIVLNADGTFEVGEEKTLTISGSISGNNGLEKIGAGTLTLSGANTYTGETTVTEGTLQLTGDGVQNSGPITVATTGTLEYNIPSGQTEKAIITADNAIDSAGKVIKTGEGTLKIDAAEGAVDAHSFVVSSGRLDMKSYFKGSLIIGEELEAGEYTTATFSPGNSIDTLTIDGDFELNPGSTLLMEIGGQSADDNDKLIVTGDFEIADGAIIYLELADMGAFSTGDTFEALIQAGSADDDFTDAISSAIVPGWPFTDWSVTKSGDSYYIRGVYDPNAVPEPSTWALLVLGAAGLLYWRKRK